MGSNPTPSADGYVADADGDFSWAVPEEEVHRFVNDLDRDVSTYLYGRGLYDVMVAWETAGDGQDDPPATRDYATLWRAADKVVYSTTLDVPRSARTRIERHFDPAVVRTLVAESDRTAVLAGPTSRPPPCALISSTRSS